jgi:hypothetical protein
MGQWVNGSIHTQSLSESCDASQDLARESLDDPGLVPRKPPLEQSFFSGGNPPLAHRDNTHKYVWTNRSPKFIFQSPFISSFLFLFVKSHMVVLLLQNAGRGVCDLFWWERKFKSHGRRNEGNEQIPTLNTQ